jgi:tRNA pseudouridine38-40 synthase
VVDPDGPLVRFEIRANAFCHQMVRSIVGSLVDVGTGKLESDELPAILAARDRGSAGQVAPPQGLTLWEVGY